MPIALKNPQVAPTPDVSVISIRHTLCQPAQSPHLQRPSSLPLLTPGDRSSNSSPEYTHSDSGSVSPQGGRLFTALFDALTQFVAANQAASAAGTPAASAPATVTAPATAAAPASTSAPTSTPASTSSSSTNSSGSSTPASSLGADLQAFLHDLFSALRQAAGGHEHARHGSEGRGDWRWSRHRQLRSATRNPRRLPLPPVPAVLRLPRRPRRRPPRAHPSRRARLLRAHLLSRRLHRRLRAAQIRPPPTVDTVSLRNSAR